MRGSKLMLIKTVFFGICQNYGLSNCRLITCFLNLVIFLLTSIKYYLYFLSFQAIAGLPHYRRTRDNRLRKEAKSVLFMISSKSKKNDYSYDWDLSGPFCTRTNAILVSELAPAGVIHLDNSTLFTHQKYVLSRIITTHGSATSINYDRGGFLRFFLTIPEHFYFPHQTHIYKPQKI